MCREGGTTLAGGSNLTRRGLGLGTNPNIEINRPQAAPHLWAAFRRLVVVHFQPGTRPLRSMTRR